MNKNSKNVNEKNRQNEVKNAKKVDKKPQSTTVDKQKNRE